MQKHHVAHRARCVPSQAGGHPVVAIAPLLHLLEHEDRRALADRNTPRALLTGLCSAWIQTLASDPRARLLLAEPEDETARTRFAVVIEPMLAEVVERARRDGALSKSADGFRLTAATGALEEIARRAAPDTVESATDAAVDALLRIFR